MAVRNEIGLDIERVRLGGVASASGPAGATAPPAQDVTAGEEIDNRSEALDAIAKTLDKGEVEALLGDADEITLRISRRRRVTI